MLVECVRTFMDLDRGTLRAKGERFEVTPDRLTAINSTKYGELAVAVPEASDDPSPAKPRASRPRKSAGKT